MLACVGRLGHVLAVLGCRILLTGITLNVHLPQRPGGRIELPYSSKGGRH